jgi:hypothetical protein
MPSVLVRGVCPNAACSLVSTQDFSSGRTIDGKESIVYIQLRLSLCRFHRKEFPVNVLCVSLARRDGFPLSEVLPL